VLDADGIVARIGADHLHGNVYRAVEAGRDEGTHPVVAPRPG
jgi:hypothetical protein